jgi:hypothetical protein
VYQTDVAEEIITQPEISETTEITTEEIQPSETEIMFEKSSEEQPKEYQTGVTEEIVPQSDLHESIEVQPEEAEPSVQEFAQDFAKKVMDEVRIARKEDDAEEPIIPKIIPYVETPSIYDDTEDEVEEEIPAPVETPKVEEDTVIPVEMPGVEESVILPDSVKVVEEAIFFRDVFKEEDEVDSKAPEAGEAPRFVTTLEREITVMENTKLVLEVFYVGKPMPKVVWTVDDEDMSEAEDIEILTEEGHSVLTIFETYLDDEGQYKVELTNDHGTCVSTTYLHVKQTTTTTVTEEKETSAPDDITEVVYTETIQVDKQKVDSTITEVDEKTETKEFQVQFPEKAQIVPTDITTHTEVTEEELRETIEVTQKEEEKNYTEELVIAPKPQISQVQLDISSDEIETQYSESIQMIQEVTEERESPVIEEKQFYKQELTLSAKPAISQVDLDETEIETEITETTQETSVEEEVLEEEEEESLRETEIFKESINLDLEKTQEIETVTKHFDITEKSLSEIQLDVISETTVEEITEQEDEEEEEVVEEGVGSRREEVDPPFVLLSITAVILLVVVLVLFESDDVFEKMSVKISTPPPPTII